MRDKTNNSTKGKKSGGIADGFDFSLDIEEKEWSSSKQPKKKDSAKKSEVDPNRNYSPYYTPKPKKGTRGGTLGRGAVDEENRKVQFSLTCTKEQKDRFNEAAKKDKRKLPDFICLAVEEYIENHGL